jgi:hypothetical protein
MIESDTRQARWRLANLRKYQAHLAVAQALARGDLVKQGCEICGTTEGRIDAHHDSYDPGRELDVRWLCRLHHTRLHAGGEDLFGVTSRDVT